MRASTSLTPSFADARRDVTARLDVLGGLHVPLAPRRQSAPHPLPHPLPHPTHRRSSKATPCAPTSPCPRRRGAAAGARSGEHGYLVTSAPPSAPVPACANPESEADLGIAGSVVYRI